jgi:tetratricopeptide (TPR) repeat protein
MRIRSNLLPDMGALRISSVALLISIAVAGISYLSEVIDALAGLAAAIIFGRGRRASHALDKLSPGASGRYEDYARRVGRTAVAVAGSTSFCGRDREISDLLGWHDRERDRRVALRPGLFLWGRRRREEAGSKLVFGPVLILIHGMPGVGKSDLAGHLADILRAQYPGGVYYANLGAAGQSRLAVNVLRSLLHDLGHELTDESISTAEAAALFRSLTARGRMIFVLDAARHAYQVQQVMPASAGCAVIVTSREDLSPILGVKSFHLQVPSVDDALDILREASQTDESVRPECALKVIEHCGRLPVAIRSAAERISLDGADLCHIDELLQASETRLDWLSYAGRAVRDRIESDIRRLPDHEQHALAMLTLVRTQSFAPWVLAPLLQVPEVEAENIVATFSALQLLHEAGSDELTGEARYAFNPLTRLAAEGIMRAEAPAVRRQAQDRLDNAYVTMVTRILTALDPTFVPARPEDLSPLSPAFTGGRKSFSMPQRWIQAEYRSLMQVITDSYDRNDYELCWRVGARLRNCVDANTKAADVIEAYTDAKKAAEQSGHPYARMDVLLAVGSFYAAIERYIDAESAFHGVISLAVDVRLSGGESSIVRGAMHREELALRKIAEACMQMGNFREASSTLDRALALAETSHDHEQIKMIRLLQAETHQADSSSPSYGAVLDSNDDNQAKYRAHLGLAESERRRGNWGEAVRNLKKAAEAAAGNPRREASVQYRLARLYIDILYHANNLQVPARGWLRRRAQLRNSASWHSAQASLAIRHAARAAVLLEQISDEVGFVRARALLSRALTIGGFLVEAEHLISIAETDLAKIGIEAEPAYSALSARVKLARGELLIRAGRPQDANFALSEAAVLFAQNGDWSEQRHAMGLLQRYDRIAIPSLTGRISRIVTPPSGPARASEEVFTLNTLELVRSEVEHMSTRIMANIAYQLQQATSPPVPTSFLGIIGTALADAQLTREPGAVPSWRIPAGVSRDLTVRVATGQDYYSSSGSSLPALPGPALWRDVAVKSGRDGTQVDLELTIDAPFMDLTGARTRKTVPVEDGDLYYRTTLRAPRPGRYDLRIALSSAGRLVQALPIEVEAIDVDPFGAGETPLSAPSRA